MKRKKIFYILLITLLFSINVPKADEVQKTCMDNPKCQCIYERKGFFKYTEKSRTCQGQNTFNDTELTDWEKKGCVSTPTGITIENGKLKVGVPCENQNSQNVQGTTKSLLGFMTTLFSFIRTVSIVIAMMSLIYGAIQLASSTGNQHAKMKAQGRIKISLIALALLGGISLIIKMAMTLFV